MKKTAMTSINEQNIVKEKFDALTALGVNLLRVAQDQASPQDVVNALDEWVDEMGELRASLPGGDSEPAVEQTPAPPGQKQEPSEKGAALQTDTSEESREKVNEQNSSQKGIQSKTFSMDDINFYHTKAAQDAETIKTLKARLDELESFKAASEKEEVAEEYSIRFPPHQRQAKYDEVMNSEIPLETWETKIEAIDEVQGTVRPAKNENHWIATKTAKQNIPRRLNHL